MPFWGFLIEPCHCLRSPLLPRVFRHNQPDVSDTRQVDCANFRAQSIVWTLVLAQATSGAVSMLCMHCVQMPPDDLSGRPASKLLPR